MSTSRRLSSILIRIGIHVKLLLEKIWLFRPPLSHLTLIKLSSLIVILIIAFNVRMLPVRWGYFLSEFDPYYQFRQTKHIIEHGLFGKNGYLAWHDYKSWYPWGKDIAGQSYLGLPLFAASVYIILKTLGIPFTPNPTDAYRLMHPLSGDPIYIFCIIFPVIFGTLTCLIIYFLGKDLGGESVGLFSALFLALDSAYISRTSLGFFDDESIGILTMILYTILFLRSLDERKTKNIGRIYSIVAGISLGYLCGSWGASRYPVVMTALLAFLLLLLKRDSQRLLESYIINYSIALFLAAIVPYNGLRFIFEIEILPIYGVLFLLILKQSLKRLKTRKKKLIFTSILAAFILVFLAILWYVGLIKQLETKFLSVLNPQIRLENPLIESVAEHRPSAWGTFYYNFGLLVFFLPVGLYFATITRSATSLYLVIYGLTSAFFASSMIRLNIVMSPAVSILSAFGIVSLLKPFLVSFRETSEVRGRRVRFQMSVSKETAAGILGIILILLTLNYVIGTDFIAPPTSRRGPRVFHLSYSPTTIAASGLSAVPSELSDDWLRALTFIREELPESPNTPSESGTVIASWWDYGYWITTIGNKTTLADNGTWNWTQIEQIGFMFMSNETEAIKILKKYNVTHVLVYTTIKIDQEYNWSPGMVGGDEGKWTWMAKIPGLDDKTFGNYTLGLDWVDWSGDGQPQNEEVIQNLKGQNTTLYKLMSYATETTLYGFPQTIQLDYFEESFFSQDPGQPHLAPGTPYIPLVCVYEVSYPAQSG